ncbi:MAG: HNH endonuclease [Chloroflexi bacterium]|jgi:hypothetical protein|nr:HNH endonuclease [Chloroflexota bacterium]
MTIAPDLRLAVRTRASFACEYCGVSEADTGGELTIDHYRPRSHHGSNEPDNLLYCCHNCNTFKADYWPMPGEPSLWNPRESSFSDHFLLLADGTLHPRTEQGGFTLRRMRLNRPPLVAYRQRRITQSERERLLERYRELVTVLDQLTTQQAVLLREQSELLRLQRELLQLLLPDEDEPASS